VITFDEWRRTTPPPAATSRLAPTPPRRGSAARAAAAWGGAALALHPAHNVVTADYFSSLLGSEEKIFGLGYLGYAVQSGLATFGRSIFNRPWADESVVPPRS
jgi:hypothetical protein